MSEIYFHDKNNRKQTIDILFENEQVIAVNKTSALPVIPDRFGLFKYNLRDLVSAYLKKGDETAEAMVVHRIDADTSGVVLFAKNSDYHRHLNIMFEEKKIMKIYHAIVTGNPTNMNGKIDLAIQQAGRNNSRMIVSQEGKPAITQYSVLESFEQFSLVELKPFTGRTHQIRVHLKAIGHPLAIDPVYGLDRGINLSMLKKGYRHKDKQPANLCDRLTLHAYSLLFNDPLTENTVTIVADPPKDFQALLKALRKYSLKTDHNLAAQ
ncbi:MAG: RluA family pseudouridine synthase [Calditrichaeota bacterium]|nr:RluA family pseudouridine synthase [Calditrichota bacterium]